jgi:tRNA-specific 2-thiouridylase
MIEPTEPQEVGEQDGAEGTRPKPRLDEAGHPVTAIVLMSGGLDSRLAARLMLEQGVKVIALNYMTCFCTCTPKGACGSEASKASRELGVPLKIVNNNRAFIEILKKPPHGYGRHMNPCIDCRIQMLRSAREYMAEVGAHFLVTGEVLGQRPMSQRRDAMRLIDREAGVEGIVVRPLCAKHLPPTLPEEKGWVDREQLLAISGRSRKPQMALAERYDIKDYPCPAGGCLLTYQGFAAKVRELIEHKPQADVHDFQLLKVGRHFRLPGGGKAIVGRHEGENERLQSLARAGDVTYDREDAPGPIVLLCDSTDPKDGELAAALCVSYSKLAGAASGRVRYWRQGNETEASTIETAPLERAVVDAMRVSGE